MSDLFSFALGSSTRNSGGEILDTWFPLPLRQPSGNVTEAARRVGNQEAAGPEDATLIADALDADGRSRRARWPTACLPNLTGH